MSPVFRLSPSHAMRHVVSFALSDAFHASFRRLDSVPPNLTSTLFLLFSGHREGISGCARRPGGFLLRLRRLGSWFLPWGTLQESTPWRLGAATPRVRSG